MTTIVKVGLPPIIDDRSECLILGTLPGDESLRRKEYYGHPRNHFWPIIAQVMSTQLSADYRQRCAQILDHRYAIWDVLHAAERTGSLDTAIRNAKANDFASLFHSYPKLRMIAFNGKGAQALYRRHIATRADVPQDRVTTITLPSTSPAYVLPLAKKIQAWKIAFDR
jgi:TDG/mug DNA glycosylase family protein